MRTTTFNGAEVLVLDDAPNVGAAFQATVEVVAIVTAGLSHRETRRPFGETLRWSLQFDSLASGEAARRLEGVLRTYTTQPVAVPVWPLVTRWADRAGIPVTAGAWLAYSADWTLWELYAEGDEPGWPTDDTRVVPVLIGRLNSPRLNWIDTDLAVLPVDFVENSGPDFAVTPKAVAFTEGPLPSDAWSTGPALCPFAVDFDTEAHEIRVEVIRDRIGFRREDAETFYEQTPAEVVEPGFTETGDPGRVLAFFLRHGAGRAFWLAGNTAAAVLTANVDAADTELQVGDTHAVQEGDRLVAIAGRTPVAFAQVDAVDPDTVTLTGAIGADLDRRTAFLARLRLVRFDRPRLTVNWIDQRILSFRIPARTVPEEVAPADDETLGATLGALPTRVYLYEFTRDYGNGNEAVVRWTSFERDVEWNGQTWLSRPITHGDIRRSLNLERESVELTTLLTEDNPLLEDVTLRSEGVLRCVIRELQLTA